MTAERWALITSVFRAALELPSERRPEFLAGACGTDDGLRRNIERMLAAQSEASVPVAELLDGSPFHLSAGEPVAQYRIESKLGEGGMGTVYLAHDTRLQRKVALKLLLPFLSQSENPNIWLLHEARAASALNHPNIVTIYEFGSDLDLDFIAMEYVEGRSLDQLIEPGGLPLNRVLSYGVQIADALAAAHDAGILHRDLKPSNIMVANGDRIKILDFGLAQRFDPSMGQGASEGGLAGTAAYMSPEQAEGRELDSRSDIFSLGVVLYEIATGVRPFTGEGRTEVLRKVSSGDPRPPGHVARVPPALDKLIRRCLAKDPESRWQSMGEVKKALEKLSLSRSTKWIGIGGLVLAASLAVALGAWWLAPRAAEKGRLQTVKFTITPATLGRGADSEIDTEVSISPNGEHITYVDSPRGQLWVRDLNQETARMVPGATRVYQVFWSPDSKHVGYSLGLRDLMRIPLEGGVATRIVTLAGDFRRASWSADGKTILYADTTGLYTVPASGGAANRLVQHPHIEHPSWLNMPDGRRAILYQAVDETPNRHGIYVRMLGEPEHHRLLLTTSGNPYPAYSPTGHIIFADGEADSSAIWALPFSIRHLRATGKPFRVAPAGSSPQVSASGTLVYSDVPSVRLQLTMHERGDRASRQLGPLQLQGWLALSPDGRQLAVLQRTQHPDIWIYDTAKGTGSQFTSDAARESPGSWSPDGTELLYSSNRLGTYDVYAKGLAPGAEQRTLLSTPEVKEAPQWSPDGRFLLYESLSPKTRRDLVFRERIAGGGLGDPVVFAGTPADETSARFSPDGKYVAYSSNETGNSQIFVSDFPRAARKWRISDSSGFIPRWVRDGRELFYNDWMRIYAVPVSTDGEFTFGKAEVALHRKSSGRIFEVSRDGRWIYTWDRPPDQPPVAVHIVHHWFEEFRGR